MSGLRLPQPLNEFQHNIPGPMRWVHQHMLQGTEPRILLQRLVPDCSDIPESFSNMALWKIILQIISEPPRRKKLPDVNSVTDVVELIKKSKKIMVLTGAGVSVSCGIPDFRSRDGVYARLSVEYPDLPDPQAMFDISYFLKNPRPFFKFAKVEVMFWLLQELYPGQFEPSLSHKFIRLIECQGHLLRNYTQNIDTLEQVAGIEGVLQCHGSFANATCLVCKHKVDAEVIRQDIMDQVIPHCPQCPAEDEDAIMKPDIVFFGESLPQEFHNQMDIDKDVCDLLIVMGSSLKVRPVALIPNSLPANVPQVLINREPLKHLTFDVELLGDCDVIVNELCHRLGSDWSSVCRTTQPACEISLSDLVTPSISPDTSQEDMPHVDSSSNLSMVGRLEKTHLSGPDLTTEGPSSSTKEDSDPSDQPAVSSETSMLSSEEIQNLRTAWKPKAVNLASKLKGKRFGFELTPDDFVSLDGTFLFVPPNRYVFTGAEAYDDESDDLSSSSMSSFRDSEGDEEESSEAVAKETKESVTMETDKRHFEIFSECADTAAPSGEQ
ncbi:hypothetical protein CAPTEDRAFT_93016 [Capitella teleta]|uniref:protein acetyllysine N-acetyltransferase n=1 Tax=Capitella teleta TaxID=283909 RepID=R7VG12_CAPTE|nr:hypothetical protein CAPTEDRAFT_93016 [Capitella teleta]|eukprot:ELU15226.1 hypothetical protein CAPTEDRAFT_93016 [Capitella teleta]